MPKLCPRRKAYRHHRIRKVSFFYASIHLTLGKQEERELVCSTCIYSRRSLNPKHRIYCLKFKHLVKQKIVRCSQYKPRIFSRLIIEETI